MKSAVFPRRKDFSGSRGAAKFLIRSCPTIVGVALLSSLAFFSVAIARGGDPAKGGESYQRVCSPCHGTKGQGDGPIAFSLTTRPQDHTDDRVMSGLTDQEIFQVIRGGGASVEKSSQMPAFSTPANPIGIALTDEEIWDVVSYIRTLHRPAESSEE